MRMIVAVDENWGIGKNGDLLVSIPDDMDFYRKTTRGKVVAMGYNTLISLPGSAPQPARLNLVLADIEGLSVKGAVVCGDMDRLLELCGCFDPSDVFVIGGGSVYRQLIPYCETAYITKMRFDGKADTFITDLDKESGWSVADETEIKEYDGIKYSFVTYKNSSPKPIPKRSELSSSMSGYFKKKRELTFEYLDIDDEDYKTELKAMLRAYFHPIENGFTASDTVKYLDGAGDISFEKYLRNGGYLACEDDFSILCERYKKDGEPTKTLTVTEDEAYKLV